MDAEIIAARDQALAYWTDPQRFPTETDTEFNALIERNFACPSR
jgi:hypothetical protein